MLRFAARAGPVRLALLVALLSAAAPLPQAAIAQPNPAAEIRVVSVEVNLTQHPAFQFVVAIPTVLRFEAGDASGMRFLHIWAYSRVDSLDVRIRKATSYLDRHAGLFAPLIEPPNRMRLDRAGTPALRTASARSTLVSMGPLIRSELRKIQ